MLENPVHIVARQATTLMLLETTASPMAPLLILPWLAPMQDLFSPESMVLAMLLPPWLLELLQLLQPAVPAPYTTATQGAGVTTIHQPAPVVTKQVYLSQTRYVSGYATKIHKPATPHLPIAVPTVLKGTQTANAPLSKYDNDVPVAVPHAIPREIVQLTTLPTMFLS